MYQVKYEMEEAHSSFEFLLEQVKYGAEVIISRNGVEIARVTGVKRSSKPVVVEISRPLQVDRLSCVS